MNISVTKLLQSVVNPLRSNVTPTYQLAINAPVSASPSEKSTECHPYITTVMLAIKAPRSASPSGKSPECHPYIRVCPGESVQFSKTKQRILIIINGLLLKYEH